jgi:outer membrane protein OmpA-like peptidoglycan-associated protein
MNKKIIGIVLCSTLMLSACVGNRSSLPPAFLLKDNVTMSVVTDYQEKELRDKLSNKFTVDKNATSLLLTANDLDVFESDNETIKPSIKRDLDIIAQTVLNSPHSELKIVSHMDNSVEYYEGLVVTTRKSLELKDYMVNKNIREKKIVFYGLSNEMPIIKDPDSDDKIKNRRIEIQINNI